MSLKLCEECARQLGIPETQDFLGAALKEASYQRNRWGSTTDEGKTDADWFWLIGYLAGKALLNPDGNQETRLHRIITVAAAAANWHAATLGQTNMRPGLPAENIKTVSGDDWRADAQAVADHETSDVTGSDGWLLRRALSALKSEEDARKAAAKSAVDPVRLINT